MTFEEVVHWVNVIKNEIMKSRISVDRNGSTQSIASGAWTNVAFTNEEYDGLDEFDTSSSKFTAAKDGWYHISFAVYMNDLGAGKYIEIRVYKNSASSVLFTTNINESASTRHSHAISVGDLNLAKDDFLEFQVLHDHGSNRDVNGNADVTYLMIHRFA